MNTAGSEQWPVKHAEPVENGCCIGQPSPTSELAACLIPLIAALHAQTAAISRLASSNEALVQAMSEGEDDPDAEPRTYLDGSSVR